LRRRVAVFLAPLLALLAMLVAARLLGLMTIRVAVLRLAVVPVTPAIAPLRLAVAAVAVPAVGVLRPMMRCRVGTRRAAPFGRRQPGLDQLLDVAQERHFLVVAERDRDAFGAGARVRPMRCT
jgi:hypothetical protein